jgi:hypothetical protein
MAWQTPTNRSAFDWNPRDFRHGRLTKFPFDRARSIALMGAASPLGSPEACARFIAAQNQK